jgi:cytochrome c oxidase subunit 2
MIVFIVISAVILVLAIFGVVFRIYSLMDIVNSNYVFVNSSNRINAFASLLFIIVSFLLLVTYSYFEFSQYQIAVASEHGVITDQLFWVTTVITGIVFFISQFLLFYYPYKYQYNENKRSFFYTDDHRLELVWTIVPAIALSLLVFGGWRVWSDITDTPPENAEVIEVVGQQFAWKVRYPGNSKRLGKHDYRLIDPVNEFGLDLTDNSSFDDFVSNTLYLPKGKPVLLKIRSKDVLHSCYLPHFRVKMDAVPGMPTRFWFVPQKTTHEMRDELSNSNFNYELACAEVCGRGHFSMKMIVKVEDNSVYEEWFRNQSSWLSKNPEYLDQVPDNLKELALIKTGLE